MALDANSNSNINVSSCTSFTECPDGRTTPSCTSTPRNARRCSAKSTPMRALSRTPSSTTKTPTSGDRFIPAIEDNLDIAHFYLSQDERHHSETERPITTNYISTLEDTIFEGRTQSKILSFKTKAPKPQTIQDTNNLYYASELPKRTSPKKRYRHIPSAPDKVLDAPELLDDYYLNVLAWGSNNVIAVGLGNTVYLLNAATSKITQLPNRDNPITALSWCPGSSNYLAVGTNTGTVQIWDTEKEKRVREMGGHTCRVGVLDWASYLVSSGSRDTNIFHHDVRMPDHHIGTFSGHTQEVCGLKWNSGLSLLASGANDNNANIWDIRSTRQRTTTVLHSLPHFAAVKALAWCPFQQNLLATGGGTNDRRISFWSSSTGSCLNSIDTKAQVCQLLWSTNYKEIVSTHGFSQNNLIVWSYPSMNKVAELSGHSSRVLYLTMSPDGETVVSGAGDETLRFWKIFEKERKALSLPKHTSQIHGINTMIR